MEKVQIQDTVKIGSWEEVDKVKLSTITKKDGDTEELNGLVIKGYEMKWKSTTNANGEVYDKNAFDNFIESYFVKGGFNMPVTVDHRSDIEHLAGRVLLIETNSVGFYFVVYVPKTYVNYNILRNLLREGIIQGFSKEGWAIDYDFTDKGMVIKEMMVTAVSLVSTPANGINFERVAETAISDKLTFNKMGGEGDKQKELFDELFN